MIEDAKQRYAPTTRIGSVPRVPRIFPTETGGILVPPAPHMAPPPPPRHKYRITHPGIGTLALACFVGVFGTVGLLILL